MENLAIYPRTVVHFAILPVRHLISEIWQPQISETEDKVMLPKRILGQETVSCRIDYNKDITEFGRKVRARREELNMSLDELADRIDSDKSSLSRIENGDRIPRLDRVLLIADALKTTPAKLLPNRFMDDKNADLLPQIHRRLMRQTAEQRRTSLRYICAMLDGLALQSDAN